MKVTELKKTEELLETVKALSDECFKGIETPPVGEFNYQFRRGDVFIYRLMLGPEHGPVVAYAIVERQRHGLYLWQIGVDSNYRNRGFATKLLQEIQEYYTGNITCHSATIELNVMIDNSVAQILYLKNGYKVIAVMRGLYGPECDGLRMRRSL